MWCYAVHPSHGGSKANHLSQPGIEVQYKNLYVFCVIYCCILLYWWCLSFLYDCVIHNQHHHHHLISYPLTARVVGSTTDDFAISFLNFPLFSSALWDLANSRPGGLCDSAFIISSFIYKYI